jgi:hypothetical protein
MSLFAAALTKRIARSIGNRYSPPKIRQAKKVDVVASVPLAKKIIQRR